MNSPERACHLAKLSFDEAISELDSLMIIDASVSATTDGLGSLYIIEELHSDCNMSWTYSLFLHWNPCKRCASLMWMNLWKILKT
ncbi:unnamed protein product [Lactuca virosa]|uniref:Uncharacterized protein n=1 Tax=Lactuca virosa TaxID=75947 RepID=A0AAU9PLT5_9ASTR|nr:unnamed protein product [Lactuca virosa]